MTDNKSNHGGMPISIILIILWMFYMVARGFAKLINIKELELNKLFFGVMFSWINYFIDIFILISFIILIVLFLKRYKNTWRYLIYLVSFLILGIIISMIYMFLSLDKLTLLMNTFGIPSNFPMEIFIIFYIIIYFILLLFYSFIIYFTYKNKNYFNHKK